MGKPPKQDQLDEQIEAQPKQPGLKECPDCQGRGINPAVDVSKLCERCNGSGQLANE